MAPARRGELKVLLLRQHKPADTLLDTFLVANTAEVPDLLKSIDGVRSRIRSRLRELYRQDRPEQERIRPALARLSEDDTKLSDLSEYLIQTGGNWEDFVYSARCARRLSDPPDDRESRVAVPRASR